MRNIDVVLTIRISASTYACPYHHNLKKIASAPINLWCSAYSFINCNVFPTQQLPGSTVLWSEVKGEPPCCVFLLLRIVLVCSVSPFYCASSLNAAMLGRLPHQRRVPLLGPEKDRMASPTPSLRHLRPLYQPFLYRQPQPL